MSRKYPVIEKVLADWKDTPHPQDKIMDEITFQDIILMLQHNSPEQNEQKIQEYFDELLEIHMIDAKAMLEQLVYFDRSHG